MIIQWLVCEQYERAEPGADYLVAFRHKPQWYSVITVVNIKTGKLCYEKAGRLTALQTAYEAVFLADQYNAALLVPEINNLGTAIVDILRLDYHSRLYKWKVVDNQGWIKTAKLGWHTNPSSRQVMANELAKITQHPIPHPRLYESELTVDRREVYSFGLVCASQERETEVAA